MHLHDNGLCIHTEKCLFGQAKMDFLVHCLDTHGICPRLGHASLVRNFPTPTTVCQMRRFLGLINFYHHFIPDAATLLQLLHAMCMYHAYSAALILSMESTCMSEDVKCLLLVLFVGTSAVVPAARDLM